MKKAIKENAVEQANRVGSLLNKEVRAKAVNASISCIFALPESEGGQPLEAAWGMPLKIWAGRCREDLRRRRARMGDTEKIKDGT